MNKSVIDSNSVLLGLLSASLHGAETVFLDGVDLEKVIKEAKNQAVEGIVYNVISNIPTDEKLKRTSRYVRYFYGQDELVKLFGDNGIPFVVLKGSAAGVYYPDPSARSYGDIDFLVSPEHLAKAESILESSGYELKSAGDAMPRHICYFKNGLEYELHFRFSHDDLNLEKYMKAGLENIESASIDGHVFPMFPKLANGIILLEHMRNHLRFGMGLRQIIDWMMFVENVLDDEFWNSEFGKICGETGLSTLAKTVTAMCKKHLGLKGSLTWCDDADERLCDRLIECIISSGNFGRKNGIGRNVETVTHAFRKEGFFRHLQTAGEYNWKAYHKHPKLKPFCWFYQIFRYIRQAFCRGRELPKDLNRGRKRRDLMKDLGIGKT